MVLTIYYITKYVDLIAKLHSKIPWPQYSILGPVCPNSVPQLTSSQKTQWNHNVCNFAFFFLYKQSPSKLKHAESSKSLSVQYINFGYDTLL